jgi:hypothetical protein
MKELSHKERLAGCANEEMMRRFQMLLKQLHATIMEDNEAHAEHLGRYSRPSCVYILRTSRY